MTDIHQLLKESVEKIAGQWVAELNTVRANTLKLEEQVLACLAKTKADITQMHALGVQVAEEAKRGQELCAKLSSSVEQITGDQIDEPVMIDRAAE